MAKKIKMRQKGAERRSEPQDMPPACLPTTMLDRAPLLATASIRDFQGGTADYVADAVEQALLLPKDMVDCDQ